MSDQNLHGRALSSAADLLTTAEAAKLLGCTTNTMRRWARAGKVPAVVLPSRRMLFRQQDVEALLEPRQLGLGTESSADRATPSPTASPGGTSPLPGQEVLL